MSSLAVVVYLPDVLFTVAHQVEGKGYESRRQLVKASITFVSALCY